MGSALRGEIVSFRGLCVLQICVVKDFQCNITMWPCRVSEAHLRRSCSRGTGTARRSPSRQQIPHRTWWSPSVWSRFLVLLPLRPRSHFLSRLKCCPGPVPYCHPHRAPEPLPARIREGELGHLPPRTPSLPPTREDPLLLDGGKYNGVKWSR